MREEKEPALHGQAGQEGEDDSFDDVRVESITPGARAPGGVNQYTPAPDWTKRISTRGKLARASIVALAVVVAVIVVLPHTSFTLPPQITRLLTPAPTLTPTPGRFTAGQFAQVPTPVVPGATTNSIVPSLRDPATASTCATPAQTDAAAGGLSSGEITLWVTHDVGQTWSRVALPNAIGTNCDVESAMDGSHRVALSVSNLALDQNGQACAHGHFYLSEDDGATWRSIEHTSVAPAVSEYGDCYLRATAKHLYLETFLSNNGDQGRSILERSDDDGQTWQRADHGLESVNTQWHAQPLDSGGESFVTLVGKYDITNQLRSDLWITRDAGATWRRIGPAAPDTSQINYGIQYLLTEAGGKVESQSCHCVFGASYSYGGSPIVGQHIYRTTDFIHWAPLPSIPVKGTSIQRSGVYQILGMTTDGRLLALGADPEEGVPALPDHNGQVSGREPSLWSWNTHTGRWELAPTHVPCENLQTCYLYPNGVSTVVDTSGKTIGTWLWVMNQSGFAQNGPPISTSYRVYIPAA